MQQHGRRFFFGLLRLGNMPCVCWTHHPLSDLYWCTFSVERPSPAWANTCTSIRAVRLLRAAEVHEEHCQTFGLLPDQDGKENRPSLFVKCLKSVVMYYRIGVEDSDGCIFANRICLKMSLLWAQLVVSTSYSWGSTNFLSAHTGSVAPWLLIYWRSLLFFR